MSRQRGSRGGFGIGVEMKTAPEVAAAVTMMVDGREVEVPDGTLVLDAATKAGVHIPIYCAHPKLDPVAVCRMCLVDIEKFPKLQPACATRVAPGMVVRTDSQRVKEVREGVLEFLLANHPLDCPVCDRGGECDLQDFTVKYGPQTSRFDLNEKMHFRKALPLSEKIELDQERCILCWRCVRYYDEVTGEKEIVLQERGVNTVVATFNDEPLESEFQGNLPEVCPVGALTHRQYRFRARPWDLQRTASVCPECSYGCNINVDTRSNEVVRFASRDNPAVDDMWLCDRGRYSATSWNGGARIRAPRLRQGRSVNEVTYDEALDQAVAALKKVFKKSGSESVGIIVSPRLTNEEAWIARRIAKDILHTPYFTSGDAYAAGAVRADASLGIEEIERCSDVVVVGGGPESYSPVLTLRLFKAARRSQTRIHRVASDISIKELSKLVEGREGMVGVIADDGDAPIVRSWKKRLETAGREVCILTVVDGVNGRGLRDLAWADGEKDGSSGVSRTPREILDAIQEGKIAGLIVWDGAHLTDHERSDLERASEKLSVVVAIESVPGAFADAAHVLFPGYSFLEKSGTVTNAEGRIQRIMPALPPPGSTPRDLRVMQDLARRLDDSWMIKDESAVRRELMSNLPAYEAAGVGGRADWSRA